MHSVGFWIPPLQSVVGAVGEIEPRAPSVEHRMENGGGTSLSLRRVDEFNSRFSTGETCVGCRFWCNPVSADELRRICQYALEQFSFGVLRRVPGTDPTARRYIRKKTARDHRVWWAVLFNAPFVRTEWLTVGRARSLRASPSSRTRGWRACENPAHTMN